MERPDDDRDDPGEISQQMRQRKEPGGPIAELPRRAKPGGQALDRQEADKRGGNRIERGCGTPGKRGTGGRSEHGDGDQHHDRMQHHRGRRDLVAGEATPMLGHDVQPSVSESVLLNEISDRPFAPGVKGARARTEHQAIARRAQPIAHVVVVPVAHRFIEQPDAPQRFGPIGRIAGAYVIGVAGDRGVTLLEVEAGHPRPARRGRIGCVIALRGAHARILERGRQRVQPAGLQPQILIDLTDDRIASGGKAGVDRRRRSAAIPPNEADRHRRLETAAQLAEQLPGSVRAAVVDDNQLERTAVGLRGDRLEHTADERRPVANRDDEGHALSWAMVVLGPWAFVRPWASVRPRSLVHSAHH
jgi:hypothetical protein